MFVEGFLIFDDFHDLFELVDGLFASGKIGDRFPGGFLFGKAFPLDEVVALAFGVASLEDALDFIEIEGHGWVGHWGKIYKYKLPLD